jgi:hypothetical protein
MNKRIEITTIFMVVPLIVLIILIVGCTPTTPIPASIPVTAGTALTPTTVCHATGIPENPYEKVIVDSTELAEHMGHARDIIPAPVSGCPTDEVVINDGTIIICHATNSEANPYEEIIISLQGLNGHGDHADDFFPASKGGCLVTPAKMSTDEGKITICHATNSKRNPYIRITISLSALSGHENHEKDIIPAPERGCPTGMSKY